MITSGVDICIRDFNRRSIRIRETRRVKVGHIATGISDQVRASRIPRPYTNTAFPYHVSVFVYICIMRMCIFCLDLREGFHSGNCAGRAGSSRWGSAGVWPWALLCSRSWLQCCLEVENQRRSAGDKIKATALSSYWLQGCLNWCICSFKLNCLNASISGEIHSLKFLLSKCISCFTTIMKGCCVISSL